MYNRKCRYWKYAWIRHHMWHCRCAGAPAATEDAEGLVHTPRPRPLRGAGIGMFGRSWLGTMADDFDCAVSTLQRLGSLCRTSLASIASAVSSRWLDP